MRSPLPANADRTNAGLATAISFQTTDGRYRPLWRAVKKTRGKSWNQSTIHQMNRAVPEGARGVASADWKDGGGHTWDWEKVNGKIVFYDAQPGKIVPTATYSSEVYWVLFLGIYLIFHYFPGPILFPKRVFNLDRGAVPQALVEPCLVPP
ncbi:toxin glutamine deamidase domain-containing protein [Corynebacterium sp.]|uniref:toxin glutamine deamidase domain-containing protein n=1 Tax=Corynebacterium sp. TaxID=1720 RepID=UPI0035A079D0